MVAINAVNVAEQTMPINGALAFDTVVMKNGGCIKFTPGSTTFNIICAGNYIISFDADVALTGTTAQVQIANNGVAIPGATATVTGTANDEMHLHTQGALSVMCSCKCIKNYGAIQVISTSADAFTNANITIEKVS